MPKKRAMANIREFKINEHLKLGLRKSQERDEIIIYVDGKEFVQCRFLLLQIPQEKIDGLNIVESIDEAAERLDKSQERNLSYISAEEEFFGHCSNLQAWYEHGYDTKLLHRNIAFSLLKKLVDAGDVQAKKAFKEEIGKRLTSGFDSVVLYLLEEGYVMYLSLEELESLTLGLTDNSKEVLERSILKVLRTVGKEHALKEKLFSFLKILNMNLISDLEYVEYNGERFFVNDGRLEIHITRDKSKKIEKTSDIIGLEKFTNLKQLHLWNQRIKEIEGLEHFQNLEVLNFRGNQIKEIKGLDNLNYLKELTFELNEISEIKGLEKLRNLEYLNLYQNKIKEIRGLNNLINLKSLFLENNQIKEIEGLDFLSQLKNLNLMHNHIRRIKNIEHLKNLKKLHLDGNLIPEKDYNKVKWKNRRLGYVENINLHQEN